MRGRERKEKEIKDKWTKNGRKGEAEKRRKREGGIQGTREENRK